MTDRLFDVICFGSDQQGEQRETAKKALSVILKVDPEQADALLSRGLITLRREIAEPDAKALVATLGKIGLCCNYKPAAPSLQTLEIVPVEEESGQPQTIECPECGTKSHFRRAGETPPEICPSCGLVFAKYERIMQEKAERDAIRRKLLQAQQLREAELRAEVEHQAEMDRRQKLEEEIRNQLRLPRMFRTRGRLIGSAATLFLAGIASGLVGARVWWSVARPASSTATATLGGPDATSPSIPVDPKQWSLSAGASLPLAPGTQLLVAMEAATTASASPPDAADTDTSRREGLPSAASDERRLDSTATPGAHRAISPEQERSGGKSADRPLAPMPTIQPGTAAVEALGILATDFAARGDAATTAALLTEIRTRVDAEKDPALQAKALALAADLHRDAGDAARAASLFEQGLQQAEPLSPGVERATALGALAATAGRMGHPARRDALLRQANQDIVTIDDPGRRLATVCAIAEQYGRAGQRGGALSLVDQVVRSARSLPQPAQRNAVLARAVLAQARLGDPNGALDALAAIDGSELQDAAVMSVVEESATNHQPVWLQELAGRLAAPRDRAVAFALLGALQPARSDRNTEGDRAFAEAESTFHQVSAPAQRPDVLSRIAQAYARAGRLDKAATSFQAAVGEAQTLTDPDERSHALGLIAERQAAVLLTDQSAKTASLIPDSALKTEIQRHIEDASRVAAILHSRSN